MNRLDWLKAIRRGLSANAVIAIGAFTTYLFSEGVVSAAAIAVLLLDAMSAAVFLLSSYLGKTAAEMALVMTVLSVIVLSTAGAYLVSYLFSNLPEAVPSAVETEADPPAYFEESESPIDTMNGNQSPSPDDLTIVIAENDEEDDSQDESPVKEDIQDESEPSSAETEAEDSVPAPEEIIIEQEPIIEEPAGEETAAEPVAEAVIDEHVSAEEPSEPVVAEEPAEEVPVSTVSEAVIEEEPEAVIVEPVPAEVPEEESSEPVVTEEPAEETPISIASEEAIDEDEIASETSEFAADDFFAGLSEDEAAFWADFYIAGEEDLELADGTYYMDLYLNDNYTGAISVIIQSSEPYLDTNELKSYLSDTITEEANDRLFAHTGDLISLKYIETSGIGVDYSSEDYEVRLRFSPDDMPIQILSLRGSNNNIFRRKTRPITGGIDLEPAVFTLASTYRLSGRVSNFLRDNWWDNTRFTFSSSNSARLYDLHFDFNYYMDFGPEYFSFRLGSYRFYYDFPEHMIRLSWGNVSSDLFSPKGTSIGIRFEKSYSYAPDSYVRPSHYEQLIVIDKPSDVQIFNEGREIFRRTLDVGTYRLRDFILYTGANKITIRITPLDGSDYQEIDVDLLYSGSLLAPGELYYGASLVTGRRTVLSASDRLDGAFRIPLWNNRSLEYDLRDIVFSSYMRYGVTPTLTFNGTIAFQNSPTEYAAFRPNAKIAMEFTHANKIGTTRYTLNVTERTTEAGAFRIPGFYASIGHQISTDLQWLSSITLNAGYYSPEELGIDNRHRVTMSVGLSGRISIFSWGITASGGINTDNLMSSYWNLSTSLNLSISRNIWLSSSLNFSGTMEKATSMYGKISATIRFGNSDINATVGRYDSSLSYRYAKNGHSLTLEADTNEWGSFSAYGFDADYSYSGKYVSGSLGLTAGDAFSTFGADFDIRTASVFADGLMAFRSSIPSNYVLIKQSGALKGNNMSIGSAGNSGLATLNPFFDVALYDGVSSNSSDSFLVYSQGEDSFSALSSFGVNIPDSDRKGYVLRISADEKYSVSGVVQLPDGMPWLNGASQLYSITSTDTGYNFEKTDDYIFTDSDGRFVSPALMPGLYGFDVAYGDEWFFLIFDVQDIPSEAGNVQLLDAPVPSIIPGLDAVYSGAWFMGLIDTISSEGFFSMLYPQEAV